VIGFFQDIVTLIWNLIDTLVSTSIRIDSIRFDNTEFAHWMGYARYAMGDTLYVLFTTTILISIGASMWSYLLKGIAMLKGLLPW
jgi:hypothetical protein